MQPAAILNILVQAQGVQQTQGALQRLDRSAQRAFGNVSDAADQSADDVAAAGADAAEGYTSNLQQGMQRAGAALKTAAVQAFDQAAAFEIATFGTADHREALDALREKRAPRFEGR